ncbi:MAG: hypothetical protein ACLFQX_02580 [Candidatus Kapaibacterium sp.]
MGRIKHRTSMVVSRSILIILIGETVDLFKNAKIENLQKTLKRPFWIDFIATFILLAAIDFVLSSWVLFDIEDGMHFSPISDLVASIFLVAFRRWLFKKIIASRMEST